MEKVLRNLLPEGKFQNVPKLRAKTMGAIRGVGNRTTEVLFRLAMVRSGIIGWNVRPKGIIGNPDFVFSNKKVVVFVDGCFWHGCPKCGHIPKTNTPFWTSKIDRNRARDDKVTQKLAIEAFRVLRFWEHEITTEMGSCLERLRKVLSVSKNLDNFQR
jgi:DNA mismatch endonuclease, patch repair protein